MSRIFVIEDDANLLYGLQARFSSEGFEVETSSGDEEIEDLLTWLKEGKCKYLILDLLLPKTDGFELLERIKGEDELLDLPVFVFTDLSDEDSRNRSLELGADYYFIKNDFDVNEFADKVIRIIGNQQKMDDAE